MIPYYSDESVQLFHGDCIEVMATLPDNSVDSIVTDPPYGLGFMGKAWDDLPPGLPWARECLRVLKPGGHLLAFGGTRTSHRLTCAIEDAGFEIRDSIAWLYGSGFPKSLDVPKAIDKAAGTKGASLGIVKGMGKQNPEWNGIAQGRSEDSLKPTYEKFAPATPDAEKWQGWGTALKPAFEPIVVGRKPLVGTVAANVLAHGTGALNIDGCRVEASGRPFRVGDYKETDNAVYEGRMDGSLQGGSKAVGTTDTGRWPANVALDGSQADALDAQSGERKSMTPGHVLRRGATTGHSIGGNGIYGTAAPQEVVIGYGGEGGASRFFPTFRYEAKAPSLERPRDGDVAHPTVKPLALMQWLVRLVTPPGGVVLEPFAGSGTTAEACVIEGFRCIAIEREADYLPLIVQRVSKPLQVTLDFGV